MWESSCPALINPPVEDLKNQGHGGERTDGEQRPTGGPALFVAETIGEQEPDPGTKHAACTGDQNDGRQV
jgi:hypothetical protein